MSLRSSPLSLRRAVRRLDDCGAKRTFATRRFMAFLLLMMAILVTAGSDTEGMDPANQAAAQDPISTCDNPTIVHSQPTLHEYPSTPFRHPDQNQLWILPHLSLPSTQDEARSVVEENVLSELSQQHFQHAPINPIIPEMSFAVVTRAQTKGRGTNGRQWLGDRGNTFVTIGMQQSAWLDLPSQLPLTLLPLQIGNLVAKRVHSFLTSSECHQKDPKTNPPQVTLKWPNDVLVNEKKISGILIESSSNWFLIGIGVNMAYAPPVPQQGPNHGRPSTSLAEFCRMEGMGTSIGQVVDGSSSTLLGWEKEALQMGMGLAYDLQAFLQQERNKTDHFANVLEEWTSWVDWDMNLVLRDASTIANNFQMVKVLPDGRIHVRNSKTGEERTLVSEYFL